MEKREYRISGPNLTETDKSEVRDFIGSFSIEAQEPVDGEIEKSPEIEQIILEVNQYREEIAAELNLPKPNPIVSAQIHLLPPKVFTQKYPHFADEVWGNHENLGDGIFVKFSPKNQNLEMLKMTLLHEGVHADSFRAFFTKNESGQAIDSLSGETRSGYTTHKPGQEKTHTHFDGFNEAVVQKTTWEKFSQHSSAIKENPSYIEEIKILDTIIKKIAEENSEDEQVAWSRIKKGQFTGDMMHLRKIAKIYGPNSLKVLARLTHGDEDEIAKISHYFTTADLDLKSKLEKELL